MTKYRKKPVEIEAFRLGYDEEPDWKQLTEYERNKAGIYIETLEGTMLAMTGDWIIKGIKGELYSCKNDIFEGTYERVLSDYELQMAGLKND